MISIAEDHGDGLIEMTGAMRKMLRARVSEGGLAQHIRQQLRCQIMRVPSYERKRCIILLGPEFVLLEALEGADREPGDDGPEDADEDDEGTERDEEGSGRRHFHRG